MLSYYSVIILSVTKQGIKVTNQNVALATCMITLKCSPSKEIRVSLRNLDKGGGET